MTVVQKKLSIYEIENDCSSHLNKNTLHHHDNQAACFDSSASNYSLPIV